jgi:hypothetical protein
MFLAKIQSSSSSKIGTANAICLPFTALHGLSPPFYFFQRLPQESQYVSHMGYPSFLIFPPQAHLFNKSRSSSATTSIPSATNVSVMFFLRLVVKEIFTL